MNTIHASRALAPASAGPWCSPQQCRRLAGGHPAGQLDQLEPLESVADRPGLPVQGKSSLSTDTFLAPPGGRGTAESQTEANLWNCTLSSGYGSAYGKGGDYRVLVDVLEDEVHVLLVIHRRDLERLLRQW